MGLLLAPTQHLPPVGAIKDASPGHLLDSISYLRTIYTPSIRGSRISSISRVQKLEEDQTTSPTLASLRADPFERSFAIQWLTSLIARAGSASSSSISEETLQAASALLAALSGTAGAGEIQRTLTFHTILPSTGSSTEVSLLLHDIPLVNQDYSSVGGQTWGGACVLAELIFTDPLSFGFASHPWSCLRILELGAGTGLVSLAVQRLCKALSIPSMIVATDFYPSVLENLQRNIDANSAGVDGDIQVKACFLDWSTFKHPPSEGDTLGRPFDLVVGADIIYEADHARWIKDCLQHLLVRRPFSFEHGTPAFHIVIPLRATHVVESATIETVFEQKHYYGELALGIVSKRTLTCETDEGDTVDYGHFLIGWQL